jgi:uroporphyrinogen decarboxylase
VFKLLEYCAEATSQFIRLMAETGAHMISNGDGVAGPEMVSPQMYREFALPYEKKMVEEAHNVCLPYVLHICGDTTLILNDIVHSGADGIELDYRTDVSRAHNLLKDEMCFLGNIDPSGVLALGTVEDVERETVDLLAVFSDTPHFILNSGCAIPPNAPPENIEAMIRIARG